MDNIESLSQNGNFIQTFGVDIFLRKPVSFERNKGGDSKWIKNAF
jgi:hypothetical protein